MNNIQLFENNSGIGIYIDAQTGESFCSISSYARLAKKDKSTISRRFGTVAPKETKSAEVVTKTGLKTVVLIPEDLIVEWLPKDNPELATQLLKLGVRSFLHKVVDYKHQSQNQSSSQNEIEQSYDLLTKIFDGLNISPEVQKLHIIDCLKKQYDLPMLSEAAKTLEQYTAVKQRYIRVTDLAQIWNEQNGSSKKPTEINLALQKAGLQRRIFAKRVNSKGKTVSDNRWELTEVGLEYGSYVAKPAGAAGTKQSIQWIESVLSLIGEFL